MSYTMLTVTWYHSGTRLSSLLKWSWNLNYKTIFILVGWFIIMGRAWASSKLLIYYQYFVMAHSKIRHSPLAFTCFTHDIDLHEIFVCTDLKFMVSGRSIASRIHTCMRNAVTLVWGSLRLAPIRSRLWPDWNVDRVSLHLPQPEILNYLHFMVQGIWSC